MLKAIKKAIGIKPASATPCVNYGYSCNCDYDFICGINQQTGDYCMPYDYTYGVSCGSTKKNGCCPRDYQPTFP
jgi:hypothetical protein